MTRHRMIYLLKERWRTEAAYRELKQELGLEHDEGRSYPGLQHHFTAALCAYAFIAAERARALANATPDTPYLVRSPQRFQKHVHTHFRRCACCWRARSSRGYWSGWHPQRTTEERETEWGCGK